MSAIRLLVLGAIRILQPVHGYDVRRELVSWNLEELANVKPGSIYSAMRTLEKDGCIVVYSRESDERRPERTRYKLTGEGEKEFELLLRQSWWRVETGADPLVPALCLMVFLPREELINALHARVGQLEAHLGHLAHVRSAIRDGATGAEGEVPEHVREILDFFTTRGRAEVSWAKTLQKRLKGGQYRFADEWAASEHDVDNQT